MPTTIFLMLVWAGNLYGGPASVGPFASFDLCERSKPAVAAFYDPLLSPHGASVVLSCVGLPDEPRPSQSTGGK